ncbi:MAG: YetF domain-containing protein [Christiangramia sp.]
MEKWFVFKEIDLLAIVLTAIGIYLAVILFTRLAGKRSFSKMSSFDFAMTVAVGSMIATTVLSKSVSLWDGIIGLGAVYILQIGVALLRRYETVKKIVDNAPLLLMDGTNILHENLRKARVSEGDLRSKLREANVIKLKEVRAVIFEATGDISVMHTEDDNEQLDDWLMQDVER